ncbi:uncharacterized protein LOC110025616 [Phalaenopsis equestris]|uniref:uncharacterized protein LOC110025616 n=1 Tax=Phalaenopsis equestris TaxID=78828 RepID=UPI0009E287DB|nr:uncharacterized protein LOC110025616 [Phalaenopsis equestris]
MAADSNIGFANDFDPSPDYNFRVLSLQTDVMNSTAEMNSGVMCSSSGNIIALENFPSVSPEIFGNSPATFNTGTSFGSSCRQRVRGLKHDGRLAVDWTYEEQNILNEGLIRCAGEGHIMKYVKIAALLPNKSARDVALRIRWLVKHEIAKRHKLEEHFTGKRIRERKEKMMHSYLSRNVHIVPPNNTLFSPMMLHADSKKKNSSEVTPWESSTEQLMDETNQTLCRIATNLDLLKLQDNINLFCHARNCILSILNCKSSMPGIMRQMPPLPISLNEELLYSILLNTSQVQTYMCGSRSDSDVKQKSSCSSILHVSNPP